MSPMEPSVRAGLNTGMLFCARERCQEGRSQRPAGAVREDVNGPPTAHKKETPTLYAQ